MKKRITFLLCLLFACLHQSNAQWSTYGFSYRTETFTPIDDYPGEAARPFPLYSLIDINSSAALDPAFLIKNFKGFGLDIEKDPAVAQSFVMFYSSNTFIRILTPRPPSDTTTSRSFWTNICAGFNMYCINDADTTRSIKMKNILNSATNDTICIIQFSRVSPHDDSFLNDPYFGNGLSTYTFQIWVHSKDNSIEFKYGPREIVDNPDFAPVINLHMSSNIIEDDLFYSVGIYGNPSAPTFYKGGDPSAGLPKLNAWPPENIVYKFTPEAFPHAPTAVNSTELHQIQMNAFPNPLKESLHITFSESVTGKVCLYNILGQNVLKTENLKNSAAYTINCNNLPNGIYTIHFISQDGLLQATKQVVVNH